MRRNAIFLLLSTLVFAVIVGCKAPEGGEALAGPAVAMTESYALPIEEPAFEPEAYPTYGSPTPVEDAYETVATSLPDSGPRYHTVVKSDTLYSIAREYYGGKEVGNGGAESDRTPVGSGTYRD